MQIKFDCPKCLKTSRQEVTESCLKVLCAHCSWSRPIGESDRNGDRPKHCLVCGCNDIWRQKDFSPRLGVAIVALGIILSTAAMIYMQPELSLGILMAFALADMILYVVMADCLVCYRCHARYRKIASLQDGEAFDLEIHERYRQEAIRLKQAEKTAAGSH